MHGGPGDRRQGHTHSAGIGVGRDGGVGVQNDSVLVFQRVFCQQIILVQGLRLDRGKCESFRQLDGKVIGRFHGAIDHKHADRTVLTTHGYGIDRRHFTVFVGFIRSGSQFRFKHRAALGELAVSENG